MKTAKSTPIALRPEPCEARLVAGLEMGVRVWRRSWRGTLQKRTRAMCQRSFRTMADKPPCWHWALWASVERAKFPSNYDCSVFFFCAFVGRSLQRSGAFCLRSMRLKCRLRVTVDARRSNARCHGCPGVRLLVFRRAPKAGVRQSRE